MYIYSSNKNFYLDNENRSSMIAQLDSLQRLREVYFAIFKIFLSNYSYDHSYLGWLVLGSIKLA